MENYVNIKLQVTVVEAEVLGGIEHSTKYVTVKTVSDSMEAAVNYISATQTISIVNDKVKSQCTVRRKQAKLDGNVISINL